MPALYKAGITPPILQMSQDSRRLNDLPKVTQVGRSKARTENAVSFPPHLTALSLGHPAALCFWKELPKLICSASSPEMGPLRSFGCLSPAHASGIIQCCPPAPAPGPLTQESPHQMVWRQPRPARTNSPDPPFENLQAINLGICIFTGTFWKHCFGERK